MLFALTLVLVRTLAVLEDPFSTQERPAEDIDALCKDKPIDLTTLAQLERLAELAGVSKCPDKVKAAIPEMVELIKRGSDDICSVDSIERLRQFYAEYLDTSADKHREQLPGSLQRLVLAYGLQMSNLCKKNMVKVLTEQGRQLLTKKDFEQVDWLLGDNGPVAKVLGSSCSPDEVFMPGDLAPLLKKRGARTRDPASSELFLGTAAGDLIEKVQTVCLRRFKPIYEPLILPLVRLANLGFNFKDKTLKSDLKDAKVVKEVGQWSRIVFLCESLNSIRIVQVDKDPEFMKLLHFTTVRILTKEEATAVIKSAAPVESAEPEDPKAPDLFVCQAREPIRFGGPICDKQNKKLLKAIDSFKTSRSEEKTIRTNMLRAGKELAKSQLKQGHLAFILSAAYKGLMRKKDFEMDPGERLVRSMDELFQGHPPEIKYNKMTLDKILTMTFLAVLFISIITFLGWALIGGSIASG